MLKNTIRSLGMAKIPEPDGYTRNPTQIGWVYPIPDGYWAEYEISFKKICGYGSGMGLGDTRPDYGYGITEPDPLPSLEKSDPLPTKYNTSQPVFIPEG
ncbi:hypothetical protein Hanom_Chr04g00296731 [Helianthus anomalus]